MQALSTTEAPSPRPPQWSRAVTLRLTHLPLEIKRLIVEQVADEDALYQFYGLCDIVAHSGGPGLDSLSLVSREFAALAQPFLWRAVDLSRWNIEGLLYFISIIIPRHGQHIRALTIQQPFDGYRRAARGIKSVVRRSAFTILGEQVAAKGEAAFLRQQGFLFCRVIARLPNVVMVGCNVATRMVQYDWSAWGETAPSGLGLRDAADSKRCDDAIVLALATALGDRLTQLQFAYPVSSIATYDEAGLADVLSQFPWLRILTLVMHQDPGLHLGATGTRGRDDLVVAISSLRLLEELDIKGYHTLFSDAFSDAWACPLKTLSLNWSQDGLSLPSFGRLLSHFSATLTRLTLRTPIHYAGNQENQMAKLAVAFPLPHLHTLSLSTDLSAPFLAAFVGCPLKYLTIGESYYLRKSAWKPFILSHATTLQRVTVAPEAEQLTPKARHILGRTCATHGIEFVEEFEREDSEAGSDIGPGLGYQGSPTGSVVFSDDDSDSDLELEAEHEESRASDSERLDE